MSQTVHFQGNPVYRSAGSIPQAGSEGAAVYARRQRSL